MKMVVRIFCTTNMKWKMFVVTVCDRKTRKFMGMRPKILKGRLRITLLNLEAMILCLNWMMKKWKIFQGAKISP